MLEITFHRRDFGRSKPVTKAILSSHYLSILHEDSNISVYQTPKDRLVPVCEFNELKLSDLVYFDDDKIAAISQSRSTISIYSISKRMTLIENAIPSQSMTRIWSYKKTCFISDQENCIFVVSFNDREVILKHQYKFTSNVKALHPLKGGSFVAGLADGKICYGTNGSVTFAEHSSSITCIEKIPSANTKFAFGSNDGEIRHLKLDISESDDPKLIIGDQVVENSPNKSGITQILFGDFDGDGDIELGILRQDNCIQVWQLIQNQPLLRYASKQSDNFGNITGLFPLKASNRDDILVLNYTGWIFNLLTDRSKVHSLSIDDFNRVKTENENLKNHLNEKLMEGNNSFIKPIDVKMKVQFQKMDALSYYKLVIECEIPIELIQICSDVVMNIIEDENKTSDTNQAVCSITEGHQLYPLIVTYRCQANTQRIEVNLRPIEGFSGELLVYIFPNVQGNKIATRKIFDVKALSLYSRSSSEHVDKSSYSSLKITGDFSADLIRDWLSSCLDDLPKDSIDWFHYRNNFTQSGLQVNLADNSCLIMSNNVSSLSVIRDSILARSIQGNMQVEIIPDFDTSSSLTLMKDIVKHYNLINQSIRSAQVQQIIRELVLQEGDRDFLPDIYKNEETSSSNILEGCHYQQLCGIILDLYIDNAKFSGKSATGRVRKLEDALNKKDFNSVLKLFN